MCVTASKIYVEVNLGRHISRIFYSSLFYTITNWESCQKRPYYELVSCSKCVANNYYFLMDEIIAIHDCLQSM